MIKTNLNILIVRLCILQAFLIDISEWPAKMRVVFKQSQTRVEFKRLSSSELEVNVSEQTVDDVEGITVGNL